MVWTKSRVTMRTQAVDHMFMSTLRSHLILLNARNPKHYIYIFA